MFHRVVYKNFNRPRQTAIVPASNEHDAIILFNNPNEIGKSAEIIEVKPARRITKGWQVSFENENDFIVAGKALSDIDLTDGDNDVSLMVHGKRKVIKVKDIVSSTRPPKDKNVMGANRRIFY